jgi:hypothetical protein
MCSACVNTVMNLHVPLMRGLFCLSEEVVSLFVTPLICYLNQFMVRFLRTTLQSPRHSTPYSKKQWHSHKIYYKERFSIK